MKEKALRETQIRSMHEMREMKRAQELRVDEPSVRKLRVSHETISRLTSQDQELQERMIFLNDSGELHEVELNCSGKISHVPSQTAMFPSPRSVLSCDKRLQFESSMWTQEYVFANPRSTFESLQMPYQRIHPFVTPNAAGDAPTLISTGKLVGKRG